MDKLLFHNSRRGSSKTCCLFAIVFACLNNIIACTLISFASTPIDTSVDSESLESKRANAQILFKEQKFGLAEKQFRAILAAIPSSDIKSKVDLLNFLGATLHAQNKDEEAVESFKKALTMLPTEIQKEDLRRAKILTNLALSYSALKQSNDAMKCFDEAFELFHFAQNSPKELAVLLNAHGKLKMDAGDLKAAECLFAESILLREKANGKISPELISPLTNLASVLNSEGKFSQAEIVAKRAVTICEKQNWYDSELLLPLLHNLGETQYRANNFDEAVLTMVRAKLLAERKFGANSEEALTALLKLSDFAECAQQFFLAENSLTRAVDISRILYGPQDKQTVATTLCLADLFELHGKSKDAERLRLLCRLSQK